MTAVVEETASHSIEHDARTYIKRSRQLIRESELLLSITAMHHAHLTAVIAQSAEILRRSKCLAPHPIVGGSDGLTFTPSGSDDVALVISLLTDGATLALCGDCIAKRTGIPRVEIPSVMERVRKIVRVETPDVPCTVCLTTRKVYHLTTSPKAPAPINSVILRFLHEHPGKVFCTACISARLFNGHDIDVAMRQLEGRAITRRYGRCSECGKPRFVACVIGN